MMNWTKLLLTFAVSAFFAFTFVITLTDLSGFELTKKVALLTFVLHGFSTLNTYIVTGRWDFYKSSK